MPDSGRAGPVCWTLTDGHAGNRRQAEALAAALGGEQRRWTLQPRAPWRWWAPRRGPGAAAAFGAGFARALAGPPEGLVAIGCGRQAALATRLLRRRGARAVQILDPRLDPRHWDLVIAPEHDGLQGRNVIAVLGSLHSVDEAWLDAARHRFAAFAALPRPRTALLLGGASAHARFDPDWYDALLRGLARQLREEGGSVLATASRRTPLPARQSLRAHLGGLPGALWTGGADADNPYPGLLAWADRIVVSADSVNMLSEAAATAVPVFVAGHDRVEGRPRRFLDSLLGRDRVRPFGPALAAWPVVPLRETARVAGEVAARLGL
ncbi:mitochondrial fission ELM1 family protein [Vulcaniibacterium tengchongense]|nr:mitochondrial fission ELM1 family protein [Vulcaniibacterium tengchongense]